MALTPIARWDVVPWQRITGPFKVGVIAFSKPGIASVAFSFNGGAAITVTSMTLNDRVNVWEYWTTFDPSAYTDGDLVTLDATVTGNDGGTRVLPTLTIVADNSGTWRRVYAWVDVAGDDNTGIASPTETGANPFATIAMSADAIRSYRNSQGWGNNTDGGIIYLNEGTHEWTNGNVWSPLPHTNEWITVTRAAGASKAITRISPGLAPIEFVHIKGVTLEAQAAQRGVLEGLGFDTGGILWLDDVDAIGFDRYNTNSRPVGEKYSEVYYTDYSASDMDFPTWWGVFARNITVTMVGNDAFVNVPVIINAAVDDIDPGPTSWHSDAAQFWGGANDNNVIVYNYKATNLAYQGIFWRAENANDTPSDGAAFVNVLIQSKSTGSADGLFSMYRTIDHLVIYNMTILSTNKTGLGFFDEPTDAGPTQIPVIDVRGCVFEHVADNVGGGNIDLIGWDNNHYIDDTYFNGVTPGVNFTIGAPDVDAVGRPNVGSPLVGRTPPLSSVVPIDYENAKRNSESTAVGYLIGPEELGVPASPTNLVVTVE